MRMTGSWDCNSAGISPERVILVGLSGPGRRSPEVHDSLNELALLTESANGVVVEKVVQERPRIDPATYIGKGKAHELAGMVGPLRIDTIIFDDDLSPAQVHNLEGIIGRKVIERTRLILDIFAQHASTREAMKQVELAQLIYLLPRLTGRWSHFSRQIGGIGLRGPGETQLEVDRRLVRRRIVRLRAELEQIEKQLSTRRTRRQDIFKVTLIGYTNAGKSTLMNALTKANVLVEDKLFATLDSTVRRMKIDAQRYVLLSDTVGFIKKLPHHLIASFHSTLGELRDADLLLHVIDLSHPLFDEQITAVNDVLKHIGVQQKPILPVFNKIEKICTPELLHDTAERYPGSMYISAKKGIGLRKLIEAIGNAATSNYEEFSVRIPHGEKKETLAALHRYFEILETLYDDSIVQIRFRGERKYLDKVKGIAEELHRTEHTR